MPVLDSLHAHRTSSDEVDYSVSSFLAAALGALYRTGDIDNVYKPATGYWSYKSRISYVTQPRTPQTDTVLTWADFATGQGLDPKDWALLEP